MASKIITDGSTTSCAATGVTVRATGMVICDGVAVGEASVTEPTYVAAGRFPGLKLTARFPGGVPDEADTDTHPPPVSVPADAENASPAVLLETAICCGATTWVPAGTLMKRAVGDKENEVPLPPPDVVTLRILLIPRSTR